METSSLNSTSLCVSSQVAVMLEPEFPGSPFQDIIYPDSRRIAPYFGELRRVGKSSAVNGSGILQHTLLFCGKT
jgi:hypothetical protein